MLISHSSRLRDERAEGGQSQGQRSLQQSGLHNLLGIPGPNSTKGEVKGKNKSGI